MKLRGFREILFYYPTAMRELGYGNNLYGFRYLDNVSQLLVVNDQIIDAH